MGCCKLCTCFSKSLTNFPKYSLFPWAAMVPLAVFAKVSSFFITSSPPPPPRKSTAAPVETRSQQSLSCAMRQMFAGIGPILQFQLKGPINVRRRQRLGSTLRLGLAQALGLRLGLGLPLGAHGLLELLHHRTGSRIEILQVLSAPRTNSTCNSEEVGSSFSPPACMNAERRGKGYWTEARTRTGIFAARQRANGLAPTPKARRKGGPAASPPRVPAATYSSPPPHPSRQ